MDESSASPTGEPWYAQGLRFTCTQCGNCCTGPPGVVWIGDEEAARLAERHGLALDEFRRRYARRVGGRWSLAEREEEHGLDCVFLDRTMVPGRAVCSVYEDRPAQCRTWPFWPENLRSPHTWQAAKRETPCPGMDEGELVPVERIRVLRDGTP